MTLASLSQDIRSPDRAYGRLLDDMVPTSLYLERGVRPYEQAVPSTHILALNTAWMVREDCAGDALIDLVLPGEVVGFGPDGDGVWPQGLRVCAAGTVLAFERAAVLDRMTKEPDLALWLSRLTVQRYRRLQQRHAVALVETAENKLIHLLLDIEDRLKVSARGLGNRLPLPLTQTELAAATGLTPSYVNRLLKRLVERGDIRLERQYITLLDRDGWQARFERFTEL